MDAYTTYRTQAATTASPAQLVLMLYDGALGQVDRAQHALADGQHEQAHDALTRAQAIITHLSATLDHDRGGDIATNLASLYGFCSQRLVEANLAKRADELPSVASVLRNLRDTWEEACVQADPVAV
jgi:flagellar secretion chaperone FliS